MFWEVFSIPLHIRTLAVYVLWGDFRTKQMWSIAWIVHQGGLLTPLVWQAALSVLLDYTRPQLLLYVQLALLVHFQTLSDLLLVASVWEEALPTLLGKRSALFVKQEHMRRQMAAPRAHHAQLELTATLRQRLLVLTARLVSLLHHLDKRLALHVHLAKVQIVLDQRHAWFVCLVLTVYHQRHLVWAVRSDFTRLLLDNRFATLVLLVIFPTALGHHLVKSVELDPTVQGQQRIAQVVHLVSFKVHQAKWIAFSALQGFTLPFQGHHCAKFALQATTILLEVLLVQFAILVFFQALMANRSALHAHLEHSQINQDQHHVLYVVLEASQM
jgi:hypothetical protein